MTLPHDDRGAEMRALFFDSAAEILQALNDDALQLESNPSDNETVRSIRRSVHTLKGDSAVMGFREMSELAHELEDVLAPEAVSFKGSELAEVVLSAADMFDALLAAYRGGLEPPNGDPLRSMIWKLGQRGSTAPAAPAAQPEFGWSEYEQTAMEDAAARGFAVFNLSIAFAADCPMREAGAAMLRKALADCGEIVASLPDADHWAETQIIEIAFATIETEAALAARLHVPGVVGNLLIQPVHGASGAAIPVVPSEPAIQRARLQATENSLRVEAARVDTILNLVGEMVIAKSVLQQAITEFARLHPKDASRAKLTDALALQSQVLSSLQRAAMQIRMVPVEQLFRRFPRLVHDVARHCSKQIALETSGQETDLDKALIDALAEPLGHIVRNAIDHGIENPDLRRAAGKPETGTVRLNAFHQGNQVVIEVSDDGRGIDSNLLLQKAVDLGFVTADAASRLTPDEAMEFIFEPGFSTAGEVTSISGRGVGMDVVRAAVQKLKGTISIDTRPGKGATFQIKLPLTLAILRGMMFRVRERLYAVPMDSVVEIRRANESDITRAGNREVMQLRDELLTIVRLRRMDSDEAVDPTAKVFVLVLTIGTRKFGVVVDAMVGEQELVIKPLDEQVVASDLVTGASVLGDGTVALILNIAEVVKRYAVAAPSMPTPQPGKAWGASA
jgi:two-component system chemotaxis sensor kinase CheA